ncbi:MAG: amidohydrolase family protein [Gammaproteobacteria bacterium]
MNRSLLLILAAALITAPAFAEPSQSAFAITNVTVIPMDSDRAVPAQTVIVRAGRIESIGPARSARVPRDATTIDGRGRYLMPGLAEMHAHVPPQPDSEQWTQDVLFLYVANGITFARSMLGAPHHLELRERAERGDLLSPRIYTSGPSLNGNSVASPDDGRRLVAAHAEAGYDFLKIHPGLDRARYDAVVAAAHEHGIAFGGHVPSAVGLFRALEARQATIDHLDEFMTPLLRDGSPLANAPANFFGWNLAGHIDTGKISAVVRATRESGVWVVPTESLIQHVLLSEPGADALAARPEMRFVPPEMRARWVEVKGNVQANSNYDAQLVRRFVEVRAELMRALHEAGVGFLLGSDAPQIFNVPGFAIHHELRMLVEAGLTPFDALVSGTRNVARFIGEEDAFGTVAVGKRADLLLLDANPLVNVANVQRRAGVMVNGRWLPEREIQAGLAEIAARYAD